MSLRQTLYFMSLVGGMSGLFAWAIVRLVEAILTTENGNWVSDLIATAVLGAFIGGLTVAFSDHYSGNRAMPRWIISGAFIGLCAGLAGGLLQIPITRNLAPASPLLSRLITWMLAGSFIGLGLGLRWIHVNKARAAHAYVGGLLGGALGGLVFASLGSRAPELSHAISFILVGVGICFGVTLAPILLRDGLLQFVSSGDARAQMKFGKARKEWELQQGDSYTIGSRSQDQSQTRYRPEIEIFIPDSAIASCHAILFGKEGRFYLSRHPDTGGQPGLAKYVVRVRGKTVVTSQELSNSDDILIGRTALKFVTRRSDAGK
jgi:MFS family permease